MTNDVVIKISAQDLASATIKKINGELEQTGKNAKTSNEGFSSLRSGIAKFTAAAAAVAVVARETYQLARAGAELDATANRFDRLAQSIGTTGDALLDDLRVATQGIYSDAELMQRAGDLMALGFAKTSAEAVRLATVAGALNMNMNQLTLTLANKTTMRFDQLGVAVEGFDKKLRELKSTGMDVDAAFKEAFLQQAEEQIERVGSVADQSIGSFMRVESAWKNFTNTLNRSTAEELGPAVDVLADLLNWLARMSEIEPEVFDTATRHYSAMALKSNELAAAMSAAAGIIDDQAAAFERLTPSVEDTLDVIDKFVQMEGKTAEQVESSTARIKLSMLERELSVGGLTDAEAAFLLDMGVQWGVYTESSVLAARKAQDEVDALINKFNNLPTYRSMTLETIYIGDFARQLPAGGLPDVQPQTPGMRALGGPVAAGGVYQVNETGTPELLTVGSSQYLMMGSQSGYVTPAGGRSGGGNVNLNVNITSAGDPEEAGRVMIPALKYALRTLGVSV